MTFIDLRNAFRSVPHKLISDMLHHIHVPAQIQEYVSHTYSKLTAEIHTDNWKSPPFQISTGVFQGDTHSPLLFLLSFNPIIAYIDHLPRCQSNYQTQQAFPLPTHTFMLSGMRKTQRNPKDGTTAKWKSTNPMDQLPSATETAHMSP